MISLNRGAARTPAPIAIPSPLAGEGSTGQQSNLVRERGRHTLRSRLWLPLSRLERFAFDPPSPARLRCATPVGEGTINATAVCQP
jgi:hypothetical protein